MSIKELIEISRREEDLTKEDLVKLANLPENFELRPLPNFPDAEEAERLVGRCIYRHSSGLTSAWDEIHQCVYHLPKLVQQALLQACNGQTKYGYGFDAARYKNIVADIKQRHAKISAILLKSA